MPKFEQPTVPGKREGSNEGEQAKIAQEYLEEYKNWRKLMDQSQNTMRNLDSLREESLDQKGIKELESELKTISDRMNNSQMIMNGLREQLSPESINKYLKPKEKTEKEKEAEQSMIAHEYLREIKNYGTLMKSVLEKDDIVLKLRKESADEELIKKLEEESKKIRDLMDSSASARDHLFERLTSESRDKYLK